MNRYRTSGIEYSPMFRFFNGLLTLVATLVLAAPCHGQPSGVRLEWSAPPPCPSRVDLVNEIERLLGRPLADDTTTSVRGSILTEGSELWLELRMEYEGTLATRRLRGHTCEGLAQTAALVIALAIDPAAVAAVQESEAEAHAASALEPSALEPSAPEPSESRPPEPGERRASVAVTEALEPLDSAASDQPRFLASAMALLSLGPLPAAAPGGGLRLGFGFGPVEISVAGALLAPQGATLDAETTGGTFGLAFGGLRGCASFTVLSALIELLPCVGVDAGAVWGSGVGVSTVRSGAAAWLSVNAGLEGRVWIQDAFAFSLLADLQVPLLRSPFVLTVSGERRVVHRPFEVGALLGLGVTFRVNGF